MAADQMTVIIFYDDERRRTKDHIKQFHPIRAELFYAKKYFNSYFT